MYPSLMWAALPLIALSAIACQPGEPSDGEGGVVAPPKFVVTVEAETDHFRVLSAGATFSEPVLDWLVLADGSFSDHLWPLQDGLDVRTIVVEEEGYWRDSECSHRYDDIVSDGAPGFYSRECGMIHVQRCSMIRATGVLRSVVIHEAIHQRVALDGYPLVTGEGAWISEGIATYFECIDDTGEFDTNRSRRISEARVMYRADMFLSLPDFIALDHDAVGALGFQLIHYPWRSRTYDRTVSRLQTQAFSVMAFLHETVGEKFSGAISAGLRSGAGMDFFSDQCGLSSKELQSAYSVWFYRLRIKGVDY